VVYYESWIVFCFAIFLIFYEEVFVVDVEEIEVKITITIKRKTTCEFCQQPFRKGDVRVTKNEASYHQECWKEYLMEISHYGEGEIPMDKNLIVIP